MIDEYCVITYICVHNLNTLSSFNGFKLTKILHTIIKSSYLLFRSYARSSMRLKIVSISSICLWNNLPPTIVKSLLPGIFKRNLNNNFFKNKFMHSVLWYMFTLMSAHAFLAYVAFYVICCFLIFYVLFLLWLLFNNHRLMSSCCTSWCLSLLLFGLHWHIPM